MFLDLFYVNHFIFKTSVLPMPTVLLLGTAGAQCLVWCIYRDYLCTGVSFFNVPSNQLSTNDFISQKMGTNYLFCLNLKANIS